MNSEKIQTRIAEILQALGVTFTAIEVVPSLVGTKETFVIKTAEASLLIGENGETLQALLHLLRRIVQKELGGEVDFSLDINDYRAQKGEELKIKAKMLAQRARDMKINVEMEPMSSYERLIVHNALSEEVEIKTESVGEGRERHVVIKYIG